MTTRAKRAKGTVLARAGNNIAELTRIGPVETTLRTEDVTTHDSEGDFPEFIGTMFESGEIEVEGYLYPGDTNGQLGLRTDHLAKTLQNFEITFPAAMATSWAFTALVTKFATGEASVDGSLKFNATLKISGQPSLSIGASAGLTTPFYSVSNAVSTVPAAAAGISEYVVNVATGTASVTLTPTASAGSIAVTAGGITQNVNSGQASGSIALGAAGSITTISVTVTETNKIPKTYTIHIARAAA